MSPLHILREEKRKREEQRERERRMRRKRAGRQTTIPYGKIKMKALFPSEWAKKKKTKIKTEKKSVIYKHTHGQT